MKGCHQMQYDEALTDLPQAISLTPNNPEAVTQRGKTYSQLGRSEEALADLTQAIAIPSTTGK